MASQADMEFVLPVEAVPLEVTAIDFELDVTAPRRTVTVEIITEGGPVEIVRLVNPTLPWKQTVTAADIVQSFRDGRLQFKVTVSNLDSASESRGATSLVTWQIEHFHAGVHGRVLAGSNLSQQD